MKIGILGGGLTGLTIALHLQTDFDVLEKNEECGGLCRSMQEEGFTFDYGGAHIIFSRNREPIDFMVKTLDGNCVRGRRNNKIFFKGRYINYPFENGLSDLPKEDNFECLYYYLKNDSPQPTNFKEWLYYTFGKGIAEKYLIPYNEKIWNYPVEKMSLHWVEGRVPKPPLEDVIKSAIGIKTEGYKHQLYFYYPEYGGIQALIKAMGNKISHNILKNFEIKKIRKIGKKWIVCTGKEEREYDKLVSTVPIFDLIRSLNNVPEEVENALSKLRYNSLITVMIGLDVNNLSDFTAMYFRDAKVKFHRVGFPKCFSQRNVPPKKSSLLAEITSNPGDRIWELSNKEIIDDVIEELHNLNIINRNTLCYSKAMRSKYAYVVYDLDYSRNIKIIKDYVAKQGIILCGRFAEFEYLNMDACVERGLEIAKLMHKSM